MDPMPDNNVNKINKNKKTNIPETIDSEPSAQVYINSLSLYLKEIGQIPLLNHEQEVQLAKDIEQGEAARKKIKKLLLKH